ncbi:hypothetical protein LTR62_005367 [Meristemomyces frigidus]|uniref:Uncharacterized protein n=1 Tax=Meristemomyces frigidus TaxID=1508187 RepID=A0AAN7YFF0_9PEZI|nr:hypothetical protein LTR62_005367 [Meristemomyces frigidus]
MASLCQICGQPLYVSSLYSDPLQHSCIELVASATVDDEGFTPIEPITTWSSSIPGKEITYHMAEDEHNLADLVEIERLHEENETLRLALRVATSSTGDAESEMVMD